jgi:hypothetical protein
MGLTINTHVPTLQNFTDVAATGKKVVFAGDSLSAKGHGIGGKIAHWFSPRTNLEKAANRATITAFVNAVRVKYGNQAGDSAANALRLRSEIGKPLSSKAINKVLQFKNMFGQQEHITFNTAQVNIVKDQFRLTDQNNANAITRMNNGVNTQFVGDVRGGSYIINGNDTRPAARNMTLTEKKNHILNLIRDMIPPGNGRNVERDVNVICALANQEILGAFTGQYFANEEFRNGDIVKSSFNTMIDTKYTLSTDDAGYNIMIDMEYKPNRMIMTPGGLNHVPLDANKSSTNVHFTIHVPFSDPGVLADAPLPDYDLQIAMDRKLVLK